MKRLPKSTRKIGGKIFDVDAYFTRKSDAIKRAVLLRNNYHSARVVSIGDSFAVFTKRGKR